MKQMEVTEKTIGENTYYIKPFPAFTAANLSGELAAILTPLLGGVVSLVGTGGTGSKPENISDVQVDDALAAVTKAFGELSGDKIERLMKKLLIDNGNISIEGDVTGGKAKLLTYDLANEAFCGEAQDMYILCYEVIKLNFNGFFRKLGTQFGSLKEVLAKTAPE